MRGDEIMEVGVGMVFSEDRERPQVKKHECASFLLLQ